jgi:hypothetical protein
VKDENEPITPDEQLVRLIWGQYFKPADALAVRPVAFQPRPDETDGISVFRLACVARAEDVLTVIAPEKQPKYAIALIPVSELVKLELTAKPARIDTVPGHAVIPEVNSATMRADKARIMALLIQLAEIASQNIARSPLA